LQQLRASPRVPLQSRAALQLGSLLTISLMLSACGGSTPVSAVQTAVQPTATAPVAAAPVGIIRTAALQNGDVAFNVNMAGAVAQGQFTPGTDQVSVVGSVSSGGIALTDPDGDRIYSGVASGQSTDSEISYSFRIARGGTPTNETIPARKYVVQASGPANVLDHWFNDQQSAAPYAKAFVSTTKTIPGEVVRFNDSSEGGAATSWSWSLPGASPSSSSAQNPTATYSTPGTYTATLTASNGSGSSTSRTISIKVTTVEDALGWWNDQVFYQVYERSFLDTNGDGTGDFAGLISKLDYIKDLGVTALYIMPVHPATNIYYGGYEVKDYKAIAAELGNQADFDKLVSEAHSRGFKVIQDMVFNHTSPEHPWFLASASGNGGKYDSYYSWRSTAPGGAWHTNPVAHSDAKYSNYYGKFGKNTPDLNFDNFSVRNAIKDVSGFWLGKNVDGFRLDAPMFLFEKGDRITESEQERQPASYAYWREWRDYIKSVNPNVMSVGETWLIGKLPDAAKYVYQGMDVGFQFDIAYGLQNAFNKGDKNLLQVQIEQSMAYYPFLQFGTFVENHDLYNLETTNYTALRLKERLTDTDAAAKDLKAKVAAAWLLTAPGVPFVYYGSEIGQTGAYARKPMQWNSGTNAGFTTGSPWEALGPDIAKYNVQDEQADPDSFLNLYKKLIVLRKAEVSLRRGAYKSIDTGNNGVYAYMRSSGSDVIFTVLNMTNTAQNNVALSVGGTSIPGGSYKLSNLLNASQVATPVTVSGGNVSGWVPYASIPAGGSYILKLNNGVAGPNAAPTIDAVTTQTLNLENGVTGINLSGISDGNFCSQKVSVTASSSATNVVTSAVDYASCNATGTLNLTPLSVGTSTVTLSVKDDGGTAGGGADTKTTSFTVNVTDQPKAPTGLKLSQKTPTSADLSWSDNSGRETGYRVYWSAGGSKPATPNATVGANVSSYTATGLSTDTAYTFWVEAVSGSTASSDISGSLILALPNVALKRPATASSSETFNGVTYLPGLAVDGIDSDFNSRWAVAPSASADLTAWIKVDLGASYDLSRVKVSWENANADSYYIMASDSDLAPDPANTAWNKVNVTGKPNQSRTDDQKVALRGRYLALYPYHKSQAFGYSIYELQAYGLPADGLPLNQPPVANAGSDQSLLAGTGSVVLSSAGSSDPEGKPISYLWTKISGPAVTLSSFTSPNPTASNLTSGVYVFQLSVSDGVLSASDQVTITVNDTPIKPALLQVGSSYSLRTVTPGFTNRYLRHYNSLGYTEVITDSSTDLLKLDATWKVVAGLADPACYSLQSANVGGQYLRHANSRLRIDPYTNTDAFKNDATFCAKAGLDGGAGTISLAAKNFPNSYLRHRNAEIWLDPSSDTAGFRADASWAPTLPFKTGPVIVDPQVGKAVYLVDRWKSSYLYDDNGRVKYAAAANGAASQWTQETVGSTIRFKNVASGGYLNVERQLDYVESGALSATFTSGQWLLEPYQGYTRLKNNWKSAYLNVEAQTGSAQAGNVDASFYSGQWTLKPVTP
jgi:alpha-amylase